MRHIFTCLTAKLPLLQAKHMQVLPLLTDPTPSWASTWVYVLDHQNHSYTSMPSIRFGSITVTVGERKSVSCQWGALSNGSGRNPRGWRMWWEPQHRPDFCPSLSFPSKEVTLADVPWSRHFFPSLLSFHLQSFPMFCLHVSFYSLLLSFSFFTEVEI